MARGQSIDGFLHDTAASAARGEAFGQESERMLRIDLDGGVWLKPGAAIAYRGCVRFERLATLGARSLKDAALRELSPLVRASGRGRLYCGDHGSHVRVIRLSGETLTVVAEDLLAFEDSLRARTALVGHGVGVAAGGLIAVTLSGHGSLAITSHGEPLTLRVTPESEVSTDPFATIAWCGDLEPTLQTDLSWRSLLHHGGQEPVQMRFRGDGFVVVQPFEDPRRAAMERKAFARLSSLLTA